MPAGRAIRGPVRKKTATTFPLLMCQAIQEAPVRAGGREILGACHFFVRLRAVQHAIQSVENGEGGQRNPACCAVFRMPSAASLSGLLPGAWSGPGAGLQAPLTRRGSELAPLATGKRIAGPADRGPEGLPEGLNFPGKDLSESAFRGQLVTDKVVGKPALARVTKEWMEGFGGWFAALLAGWPVPLSPAPQAEASHPEAERLSGRAEKRGPTDGHVEKQGSAAGRVPKQGQPEAKIVAPFWERAVADFIQAPRAVPAIHFDLADQVADEANHAGPPAPRAPETQVALPPASVKATVGEPRLPPVPSLPVFTLAAQWRPTILGTQVIPAGALPKPDPRLPVEPRLDAGRDSGGKERFTPPATKTAEPVSASPTAVRLITVAAGKVGEAIPPLSVAAVPTPPETSVGTLPFRPPATDYQLQAEDSVPEQPIARPPLRAGTVLSEPCGRAPERGLDPARPVVEAVKGGLSWEERPANQQQRAEAVPSPPPESKAETVESPANPSTRPRGALETTGREPIVELAALRSTPRSSQVQLLLHTEPLGRVAVRLVERAGLVEVAVRSSNHILKTMLSDSLPSLIGSLTQRGFDASPVATRGGEAGLGWWTAEEQARGGRQDRQPGNREQRRGRPGPAVEQPAFALETVET